MPEHKNQHYVPQHYLRRFAHASNAKLTSLVHLPSKRFVPCAPIKSQCSDDYFYGMDGKMENILAGHESQAEIILKNITQKNDLPFGETAKMEIILFMAIIFTRTKRKADEVSRSLDASHKEMLKRLHKAGKLPQTPPGLSIDKVKFTFPSAPGMAITSTLASMPIMTDLSLIEHCITD